MIWDKFEINNSGKVTIERVDRKKVEKLDVLELPSGIYFIDKKYLKELTEYSPATLKDTPVYSLVGSNMGDSNRGITIELRELKKLNRLEDFIKDINKIEDCMHF
jgi:hypothetical protein